MAKKANGGTCLYNNKSGRSRYIPVLNNYFLTYFDCICENIQKLKFTLSQFHGVTIYTIKKTRSQMKCTELKYTALPSPHTVSLHKSLITS